jgi:predicted AAA+ superfamily ATPase
MHLDLERPSDLGVLEADLEGFFAAHPRQVVIDEAQRLPGLFPVLRHAIDRGRGRGRFALTGSASPGLLATASETLAGRIGLVELTPFTARELAEVRGAADRWFWGGYPPVHALRSARARADWLDAYVSTFLERDLPALGLRLPAPRLRKLWTMLTHVHGSLLNVSDLARSLGVSSHAVAYNLDVLEATFMIRRLQPHHANIQKRLTKSPKVYVRDTGLLHFLAGLRRPRDLETWPRRGHSFEGLVIEELVALASQRLVRPEITFWRTQAGAEVDLLIGDGRRLIPIEVKLGHAITGQGLRGLRECMKDLGLPRGYVVTSGPEPRRLGRDIEIIPWSSIARREFDFGLP